MDTTQTGISDELNHALTKNLYNFLIYTEYHLITGKRAFSSVSNGKLEDIGLELEKYIIPFPQNNDEKLCTYVYQGVLDFQIKNWE